MPMHNWTRVDAGIYHAFHHAWISEISRTLNKGLLPADSYAMPEHHAESVFAFYRRKQNSIAIRHVSGDSVVAMIEIVSPGNKSTVKHFQDFLRKPGHCSINVFIC
jgi:hypothetical protein